MTTTTPVSPQQRFSRTNPCPICGSHSSVKQGTGERCYGYMSDDGEYANCTRTDFAGSLEERADRTYGHKLYGECKCGTMHNSPHIQASSNGHKKTHSDFFTYDDPRASAYFPYYDEQGILLFTAVRYEWPDEKNPKGHSKTVRQFHKENGKQVSGIANIRRVLYRLQELLKEDPGKTVYIPEGENKVEALRKLGFVATCNPMGAKKWQKEYSAFLKDRHVVILPDNDKDGIEHAKQIYESLQGIAASVRVVKLPGLPDKGDVIDWLANGGAKEKLEELTQPQKRKFTYASEVEPKPYEWEWEDRIAKGEFTLAVGDAGIGKGLTISKIIAHITQGESLPGDTHLFPGGVILMSPEDSEEHSIVPRLMAAKADLSKVLLLNKVEETDIETGRIYKRPVSFPEDTPILIEAIEDAHAALIVIDPILSMLSDRVDAHKNHAVRRAVSQVLDAARDNGCALLGIMHTTKTQHPNVLFRSSSSSAFIEMARASLFFVPDPDGFPGESGVIVNYKNNLRKKADSVRYAIHQSLGNIGYITWEGMSTRTRDELLGPDNTNTNNNRKSEQEDDLNKIFKENSEAMTPEEILPHTKQRIGALKTMLSRKAESGLIMRTSRGKYTYIGNPLYSQEDVTNVTSVTSVTSATNVTLNHLQNESYMKVTDVTFDIDSERTSNAASGESYKGYIEKQGEFTISSNMTEEQQKEHELFKQREYESTARTLVPIQDVKEGDWLNCYHGHGKIIRKGPTHFEMDIFGKKHRLPNDTELWKRK